MKNDVRTAESLIKQGLSKNARFILAGLFK